MYSRISSQVNSTNFSMDPLEDCFFKELFEWFGNSWNCFCSKNTSRTYWINPCSDFRKISEGTPRGVHKVFLKFRFNVVCLQIGTIPLGAYEYRVWYSLTIMTNIVFETTSSQLHVEKHNYARTLWDTVRHPRLCLTTQAQCL